MSSPDRAENGSTSIPVAPREIVDLVTRLLRIHGVDADTAHTTATAVMYCQADGHPAVAYVIDTVELDAATDVQAPHEHRTIDSDTLATAYRSGVSLDVAELRDLERAAAGFLVAEHVLDSIADEPTVG